jgi:hypothetical protein
VLILVIKKLEFVEQDVPLFWPVDDPESFKSDVLRFAPEGNPLREYVEKSL